MSRRKSDIPKAIPIATVAGAEAPEWNDPLRGILVALVKDRRPLWDARFRTNKDRCMQLFREIAIILSNQDKRMNEWAVLEKWCWLVEMFMRAQEKPSWSWRFKGAMSFIHDFSGNGTQYLNCLSSERLIDLTKIYSEDKEELNAAKEDLSSKIKKGSGWFFNEMSAYSHPFAQASTSTDSMESNEESQESTSLDAKTTLRINGKQPVVEAQKSGKRGRPSRMCTSISASIPQNINVEKEVKLKEPNITVITTEELSSGDTQKDKDVKHQEFMDTSLISGPSTATTNRVDVGWTSARISVLIDAIKERPALWHSSHPHYRSMSKRKEYLSEVAEKVRSVAGGENINEDHVSGKWSILRECFNKQLKKVRGGGVSGWEHYARLVFLTPEVMSACRFDDLEAESHGTSNVDIVNSNGIGLDIQSQLEKMLGYVPEPLVSGECEPPIKRVKLSPKARERDIDADRQRTTRMQQASVVSTWVPPREDSIAAAMQAMTSTSTPPTATAQIVTTNSALTSILNKPRQSINGSISFNGEIPDQEDKWTLMGRMIEQTCRELEVKSHELAIHLQKDLNDIIFKYQLEGLKRK